jgi:hypothetical protein
MARISLPRTEYPDEIKKALLHLEKGDYRKGLRNDTIRKITDPLGQLLFVARQNGLQEEFNVEATGAYILDLDRRKVKNSTKQTYIKGLLRLAVEMKWQPCDLDKLKKEMAYYKYHSKFEVPEKERKLMENPIEIIDIATAAREWFIIAQNTKNETRRRSNFQRAAFLAFTSLVPSRVGDMRKFRIGEDIIRTHDKWMLSTIFIKNSYEQFVELHGDLTPYLDALVHLGDSGFFLKRLRERTGEPLFAKKNGSMVLRETLYRHFSIATGGHSPHIARTLTHDFFAGDDDLLGNKIARALCGQASLDVSKAYEVHAKRARFTRAQKRISKTQKKYIGRNQK